MDEAAAGENPPKEPQGRWARVVEHVRTGGVWTWVFGAAVSATLAMFAATYHVRTERPVEEEIDPDSIAAVARRRDAVLARGPVVAPPPAVPWHSDPALWVSRGAWLMAAACLAAAALSESRRRQQAEAAAAAERRERRTRRLEAHTALREVAKFRLRND